MFNESMLLASLYFLVSQTEFINDPTTRYNFAWAFNCVIILPLIAVNLAHSFFIGVRKAYADFKAYMRKDTKARIVVSGDKPELDDSEKVYNYAAY